jgi:hypothetical protein
VRWPWHLPWAASPWSGRRSPTTTDQSELCEALITLRDQAIGLSGRRPKSERRKRGKRRARSAPLRSTDLPRPRAFTDADRLLARGQRPVDVTRNVLAVARRRGSTPLPAPGRRVPRCQPTHVEPPRGGRAGPGVAPVRLTAGGAAPRRLSTPLCATLVPSTPPQRATAPRRGDFCGRKHAPGRTGRRDASRARLDRADAIRQHTQQPCQ